MTLHGIDISHWQTGLDVAATDAQFVIIKVTDGQGYVDPAAVGFAHQIINAGRLGGAYHFYEGAGVDVARREADHFIDQVRPVIGRALLALDFEHSTTDVAGAHAFLDRVRERTGVSPLIYMSQSVANAHDWSAVAKDYALWVARYTSASTPGPTGAWKSYAMWQYTDAHHTAGYSVDGDRFYGDKTAWRAFAIGQKIPDDDTPGDDDMPQTKAASYGGDVSIDADKQWHTLRVGTSEKTGHALRTVLHGPAAASGTLYLKVAAPKAGTQLLVRSVYVDADAKITHQGWEAEVNTAGGDTSIVYPYTEHLGKGDELRFQLWAAGGGKVTVKSLHARALYW